MTKMQIAYGKALIKKMAQSKKEQLAQWKRETWKHPRYDEVFFEGLKWLDKQ